MTEKPNKKISYVSLHEAVQAVQAVQDTSKEIGFYAVVLGYSPLKHCSPLAKDKYSMSMTLIDASTTEYKYPIVLNIFGNSVEYFPTVRAVGDILRCRRVRRQIYKDRPQLVANKNMNSSFVAYHRNRDPILGLPIQTESSGEGMHHMGLSDREWKVIANSLHYTFTPTDVELVNSISTWFASYSLSHTLMEPEQRITPLNALRCKALGLEHAIHLENDRCDVMGLVCRVEGPETPETIIGETRCLDAMYIWLWDGSTPGGPMTPMENNGNNKQSNQGNINNNHESHASNDSSTNISAKDDESNDNNNDNNNDNDNNNMTTNNDKHSENESHLTPNPSAVDLLSIKKGYYATALLPSLYSPEDILNDKLQEDYIHEVERMAINSDISGDAVRIAVTTPYYLTMFNAIRSLQPGTWIKVRNLKCKQGFEEQTCAEIMNDTHVCIMTPYYSDVVTAVLQHGATTPSSTGVSQTRKRKQQSDLGESYTSLCLVQTTFAPAKFCVLAHVEDWHPRDVRQFVVGSGDECRFAFQIIIADDTSTAVVILVDQDAENVLGVSAKDFLANRDLQAVVDAKLRFLQAAHLPENFYLKSYYVDHESSSRNASADGSDDTQEVMAGLRRFREKHKHCLRLRAFKSSINFQSVNT